MKYFFLFIMISMLFLNVSLYSQDTTFTDAKIYIGYNEIPDSLYLNGKIFKIPRDHLIQLNAGEYDLKAYLSCHETISKTIVVRPQSVFSVRLKFKHLMTPEYTAYKRSNIGSYTISLLTIAPGFFYERGMTSLLPIGMAGLAGQFLWDRHQNSYFEPCNRNYSNPDLSNNSNKIFLGIGSGFGGEHTVEIFDLFDEVYDTPNARIGVKRYLKKKIIVSPDDFPLSSYNILLSYQRDISNDYSISLRANIFPDFVTKIELYDENSPNSDYTNLTQTKLFHNLFYLVSIDFGYKIYQGLNNSWMISLGGFMSNTISENTALEVVHPSLDYFESNPITTNFNFRYSASGATLGIKSEYRFTHSMTFGMQYKIYYSSELELNTTINKKLYYDISSGLVYGF